MVDMVIGLVYRHEHVQLKKRLYVGHMPLLKPLDCDHDNNGDGDGWWLRWW